MTTTALSIVGAGIHRWLAANGPAGITAIRAEFCADPNGHCHDVDAAAVNRVVYNELSALEQAGAVTRCGDMLWVAV